MTDRASVIAVSAGDVLTARDAVLSSRGEEREHEANVRRLRLVLGLGLLLWNVIGIPNDLIVCETFGCSYREFTIARIITTMLQLIGWAGLFARPGKNGLRAIELTVFVSTSAGLAALNHGIAGPTPIFVACAMLAQGISIPRPRREGALLLGATWLSYPVTFAIVEAITHRNAEAWSDPARVASFAQALLFGLTTLVFVVLGGDALSTLRRSALAAQRVGRYRLIEKLGGGGMGEVWSARHPGLGQEVALKLGRPSAAGEAITREAEILAALEHPSTVRLLDRGRTEDGRPYYAMEKIRGRTLASAIEADGPLDEARARRIGAGVSRALAELHARGLVHRDVKPENVMLASAGPDLVKLIDFGIACARGEGAGSGAGSSLFMAPEQRAGARAEPTADVFAVGALVYFALVGASPLAGADGAAATALAAAREQLDTKIPAGLRPIVRRCLETDPARRFEDATALATALDAMISERRLSG